MEYTLSKSFLISIQIIHLSNKISEQEVQWRYNKKAYSLRRDILMEIGKRRLLLNILKKIEPVVFEVICNKYSIKKSL